MRPLGLNLGKDLRVGLVDVGKVHELIVCAAVEAQAVIARGGQVAAVVHAAQVERGLAPHGELQVQAGQSRAHALLAQPGKRVLRRLQPAQAFDQVGHVVDHQHGPAVDRVIAGQMEVLVDHAAGGALELAAGLRAVPDQRAVRAGAPVPQGERVVIGPHEVELHLIVVFRAQEALVQALLQEGAAVVPVPVVDEHVHAVRGRLGDLALHDARIGLVLIAPQRPARPGGVRIGAVKAADGLPFADALRPEDAGSGFLSCIGRPDIGGHVVFSAHAEASGCICYSCVFRRRRAGFLPYLSPFDGAGAFLGGQGAGVSVRPRI